MMKRIFLTSIIAILIGLSFHPVVTEASPERPHMSQSTNFGDPHCRLWFDIAEEGDFDLAYQDSIFWYLDPMGNPMAAELYEDGRFDVAPYGDWTQVYSTYSIEYFDWSIWGPSYAEMNSDGTFTVYPYYDPGLAYVTTTLNYMDWSWFPYSLRTSGTECYGPGGAWHWTTD